MQKFCIFSCLVSRGGILVILIRNALYEVLCTGLFYKNDFSAFCIDVPSYVVGFVIIAVNIYKCVSCFAASPKFSLLIFLSSVTMIMLSETSVRSIPELFFICRLPYL